MARIRTIKPDFWEDETVALLSRDARLLFVATWNLADDEGLLRWTAPYLKASAFMYDDDIDVTVVEQLMAELAEHGMIFPYRGGKTQQRLAYVVNFQKHQRINRPSPSKLPPPSIQNREVQAMYGRRDGMVCHLCKDEINPVDVPSTYGQNPALHLSLDHKVPRVRGGSDCPSNIAASHVSCNKSRQDRPLSGDEGVNDSVTGSVPPQASPPEGPASDSLSRSVNDSVSGSLPEGKGREREGEQGKGAPPARAGASIPDPARPRGRSPLPDATVAGNELLAEHLAAYPHSLPRDVRGWTSRAIERQLAEDIDPGMVRIGLALMREDQQANPGRDIGPGLLPKYVEQALRGIRPGQLRRRSGPDPNAGIYRHDPNNPETEHKAVVLSMDEWMKGA